jgi:hypothetical protein
MPPYVLNIFAHNPNCLQDVYAVAAVLGSGAARDLAFKCAAAFASARGESSGTGVDLDAIISRRQPMAKYLKIIVCILKHTQNNFLFRVQ